MKNLKKVIAFLLAVCMVTGILASVSFAEEDGLPVEETAAVEEVAEVSEETAAEPEAEEILVLADTGECGEGLSWDYEDGILTISGSGAMDDYSAESPAPWSAFAADITEVNISAGVTAIGANAFEGCTGLADVNFDGTEAEWNSVSIGSGNETLSSAEKHFKEEAVHEDGWFLDEEGNSYYYTDNVAAKGWKMIDDIWYFFESDGVMKTGWLDQSPKWYYLGSDGKMLTGWQYIDDNWYLFKDSGAMYAKTWVKRGNTWYFFHGDGHMITGWEKINGVWYYFKDSGAMVTGWQYIDGQWYLFKDSGAMYAKTWVKRGSTWYFFHGDGHMITGWEKINKDWYYFKDSGAMATGWQYLDGDWYYFKDSGAMAKYWLQLGNKWYCFEGSGQMITGWKLIDGLWYYFKDSGAMVTGWLQIGDNWYYFNRNGALKADQKSLTTKAQQYSSSTNFLILVDCSSNIFGIFQGSKGNWRLVNYWECATGAGSTKTPKGVFQIGYKLTGFSGPDTISPLTYSNPLCYTVYWATNYAAGGYFIHSTLYRYQSWTVMDDRLGMDLSHGCIRLKTENAKWVYDNIPYGTTIVTY